jgi:hypothetical protein
LSEREVLTEEELHSVNDALSRATEIIKKIEAARKSRVLVFYCHHSISQPVAYRLNKVLRKMGDIETLDVLLESGGGDINAAYKILKMFKQYAKKTRVIVPFYVKSAASLIALGADELVVCRGGELGPIDPQVRDPYSGQFIPTHSIKETINFIESTKDPLVKLSLADKIPPLLIGAYREAGESSKQYLEEIFNKLGEKKDGAIHTFTEKFLSHGYPIDREFLKAQGVKISDADVNMECTFCDLHEIYSDLFDELLLSHPDEGEILIIQANGMQRVVYGNDDLNKRLNLASPHDHNVETDSADSANASS